MRRARGVRSAAGLVAGIASVMLAGCARPERIVIGVALTDSEKPAVELAVEQINAGGGIGGVPVELAGLDWRISDAAPAAEILEWADRFAADDDLVAIVGHSDSASTLAGASIYNQRRIPQIVTIASNPAITGIGEWTYRLCLSDARQGPALAEYAFHGWHKRRIALFYVNDDYGRGLAREFTRRARELGAEIVASTFVRSKLQPDDRMLIEAAVASFAALKEGPDLVVLFTRPSAGWTILRAIREAGLEVEVLGGDNLSRPVFAAREPALTEGIRVSHFLPPGAGGSADGSLPARYEALTGEPPDYGAVFAYDAVLLLREAIAGGGPSRAGVKAYLDEAIATTRTFSGLTGEYHLAEDHDARRDLFVVEARSGRHHPLQRIRLR